jgi:aminoglycoside/choline kinase family phosphotransferase
MNKDIQKFLSDNLDSTASFEIIPIKKGGSDRSFFRVCLPDKSSFIFMRYGTEVEENSYWAGINKFLAGLEISVPQIVAQDVQQHFILMEDLGDIDLWSQSALSWDKRRIYYYQVLTQIRQLHTFEFTKIPSNLKLTEGYGPKLYRWEHDYFLENLVGAVCQLKLSPSLLKDLHKELDGLIIRLQNIEPCLIHRDLQSQNIMLKNGKPVLIDFQGMRLGNFFYDLGSLICDPYVVFTNEERKELISFYYQLAKPSFTEKEFKIYFREASAQRLMQALGAYGFLGLKKNKTEFLRHIENGVKNLILVTSRLTTLSTLHELVNKCADKMSFKML